MKEKIVVENKAFLNKTDFVCIEDIVKDLKVEYKKEQVPESYEELRSLCFKIGTKDNHVFVFGDWGKGNEYLMTHCLKFYPDGKICMDGDNVNEFVVAENKSPQQMWQIIKALIGEE